MLGYFDGLDPEHNQKCCMKDIGVIGQFGDIGSDCAKQVARPAPIGSHFGVLRDGLDFEPERFFKRNGVGVIKECRNCLEILQWTIVGRENKITSAALAA